MHLGEIIFLSGLKRDFIICIQLFNFVANFELYD